MLMKGPIHISFCKQCIYFCLILFLTGLAEMDVYGQKELEKANTYFSNNQFHQALELYIVYENSLPDSLQKHPVLIKIATCYSELNNPKKAAYYYSLAINIRNNLNEELKIKYVNTLLENAQYLKARDYLLSLEEPLYLQQNLLASCDFAMANRAVNEKIEMQSVNNQFGTGLYGMTKYKEKLLYLVPSPASSRQNSNCYLYDDRSELSIKHEFQNKRLKETAIYTPSYDPVNNILFFSRNLSLQSSYYKGNREKLNIGIGGSNNLGIFFLNMNDEKGKNKPEVFPFLNIDFNSTHPFINETGDTLYFASDIPGGYGGYDIYYSVKEGESWSRPVNLGARVNTLLNEGYPFYRNGTLYFASNGQPGYGGLDIFKYSHSDNQVSNLGMPINSSSDDFYYILKEEFSGFIVSNRNRLDGRDIIYKFIIEKY